MIFRTLTYFENYICLLPYAVKSYADDHAKLFLYGDIEIVITVIAISLAYYDCCNWCCLKRFFLYFLCLFIMCFYSSWLFLDLCVYLSVVRFLDTYDFFILLQLHFLSPYFTFMLWFLKKSVMAFGSMLVWCPPYLLSSSLILNICCCFT